ncbi:MAG: 50S ribosomal protein L29 [Planctomycetes bacterium]|nr:50S ribosomal protein L29 [Planctomycetota bacterium]
MKKEKFNEYRAMGIPELTAEIDKRREQVYKLREKKVYEDLSNPFEIRILRREIAQLATLVRQKELAANPGPSRGARSRAERRRKSRVKA